MDLRQKRASLRIDSDLPVAVLAGATTPVVGSARNISLGGISFDSDMSLQVGQRVSLQLATLKGMVEFDAVVRRKADKNFACEFVDADLNSAKVLAEAFFPAFEP